MVGILQEARRRYSGDLLGSFRFDCLLSSLDRIPGGRIERIYLGHWFLLKRWRMPSDLLRRTYNLVWRVNPGWQFTLKEEKIAGKNYVWDALLEHEYLQRYLDADLSALSRLWWNGCSRLGSRFYFRSDSQVHQSHGADSWQMRNLDFWLITCSLLIEAGLLADWKYSPNSVEALFQSKIHWCTILCNLVRHIEWKRPNIYRADIGLGSDGRVSIGRLSGDQAFQRKKHDLSILERGNAEEVDFVVEV